MAIIHWDKSILTFHLKEIIEDHESGDRTALFGLGTIVIGAVVLPAAVKLGRPILKQIIKSGLSVQARSSLIKTPTIPHNPINN
ncbi:hypothetical protein [Microcystis aeruginosa]|jgi:hypothetical protein|uniref:hypothetical protein n=1 Tax=Microcystis aeruginosa TaxID=1126 RepID=UPI000469EC51|nr:hypothetical protein [Microcystis aeruginosa]MDB9397007.1 hypothetical protein [Microcystis aeruginosa CS-573]